MPCFSNGVRRDSLQKFAKGFRIATFILVALQAQIVFILVVGAATTRSDAAGQGMANAYAIVAAAVFIVLALPALAVAIFTEQQWLALTIATLGVLVFVVFMAMLL
jgi:hypothetical protein